MRVLMINASPKRILCASKYYLALLRLQMPGCETDLIKLTGPNVYNEIFSRLNRIDALVIALPVYVDSVPSNVLRFMQEAEKYIKDNDCRFKLYIVSNCGFVEGRQCKHLLSTMRSFAVASSLEWGGGIGIGGGEALNFLRIMPLSSLCGLFLSLPFFLSKGDFWSGLASYPWMGFIINMAIFFAFSSWMLIAIIKMGWHIRRLRIFENFYASFLMPPLLFAATSNTYWIIRSAVFGTGFWELYNKKGNPR